MMTFFAVIQRNWLIYSRNFPIAFFINRVMGETYSIISVWLLYEFLFLNTVSTNFYSLTGTKDYLTYAVIGIAFYNFAVATLMNSGRSLITELREGTLNSLLITPYSRWGYFIGIFIEQLLRALLEFFILMCIGLLFGANLTGIPLIYWLITLTFASVCFFSMSLMLSNIMLYFRDTFLSQNTLFLIMLVICGVTFPTEFLPEWIQWLSYLIPLTQVLELFRILTLSESFNEVSFLIISGLLVSGIYLLVGYFWYLKVERKLSATSFD